MNAVGRFPMIATMDVSLLRKNDFLRAKTVLKRSSGVPMRLLDDACSILFLPGVLALFE